MNTNNSKTTVHKNGNLSEHVRRVVYEQALTTQRVEGGKVERKPPSPIGKPDEVEHVAISSIGPPKLTIFIKAVLTGTLAPYAQANAYACLASEPGAGPKLFKRWIILSTS